MERDMVVLEDTVKLLHKLLKEQGRLISDYVTGKVAVIDGSDEQQTSNSRDEDGVYTFLCQQRFDKIDKDVQRMRKLIENLRFGLKAS